MVATLQHPHLSPQEYLEWEAHQSTRHEYIGGEVYAMTGGTIPHSEIAVNMTTLLKTHLRGRGCRTLSSDAKIGITDDGPFFYPDASVTCDPRDRNALKFARYPILLVEVLSPTTEAYDRGNKFAQYRRLDSLKEYVLISSNSVNVEVFCLNQNGKWEFTSYGEGDEVHLTSVDLTVAIALLYEDVMLVDETATP